jgi:hypothetical protein
LLEFKPMSAQALPVSSSRPSITVRRAKPEDASACGRVCFDAFYKISTDHGFEPVSVMQGTPPRKRLKGAWSGRREFRMLRIVIACVCKFMGMIERASCRML